MNGNINNVSRETIQGQVENVLSNISGRMEYNAESVAEKTTKKGNLVVQKTYNFAVKSGKRESMTISDAGIIASVEKILMAERGKKFMGYVVCKELSKIADSGKLEKMGFKTAAEFAKAMFGFEVSTANHYVRIGRNFITDDYKVVDGLPELSIGHFIELNKYVGEDGDISAVVDMYLDGTLVDGMSTKQVRKALIERQNAIEAEALPAGESDESENVSENTSTGADTSKDSTSKAKSDSQQAGEEASAEPETFDSNIECGKALNALAKFSEVMENLNSHGMQVSGYEDSLVLLANLVKGLIK